TSVSVEIALRGYIDDLVRTGRRTGGIHCDQAIMDHYTRRETAQRQVRRYIRVAISEGCRRGDGAVGGRSAILNPSGRRQAVWVDGGADDHAAKAGGRVNRQTSRILRNDGRCEISRRLKFVCADVEVLSVQTGK